MVTRPAAVSTATSRESLLSFIRYHTSDLEIRKARTEDGRRACLARFRLRGELVEVEAVEADGVSPDDEVVRRAAWLVYRRLGIRSQLDVVARDDREQAIVRAVQQGDIALAERLSHDLVMSNEGVTRRAPIRPAWER